MNVFEQNLGDIRPFRCCPDPTIIAKNTYSDHWPNRLNTGRHQSHPMSNNCSHPIMAGKLWRQKFVSFKVLLVP